jgi:hypothetical protein
MADTGAPWFIPYAEPADLVRDWPGLSEDVADAVAAGLTAAGPEFVTAASDSIALDFETDKVITRAAAGAVTFTGTNYTAGKSISVRVVAGGAARDLTFPADWKFVSFKPTELASGKVGVLAATSFGTAAGDVVAAWAAEA